MARTETPTRTPGRGDAGMSKIAIGLVAVLALVALIAGLSSGGSNSTPLMLSSSVPLRVTVPSIDASSSLVPLGQNVDGSLEVPPLSRPMQAAWYDKSPTPGAVGPAIVLGHIDGNGKEGIFYKLADVKAGQEVMIDRADGQTAVFTIAHIDTVPKDAFPTQEVYGDTSGPEIRLITCGGELDRKARSYLSNVVVYANLTSVRKTA